MYSFVIRLVDINCCLYVYIHKLIDEKVIGVIVKSKKLLYLGLL